MNDITFYIIRNLSPNNPSQSKSDLFEDESYLTGFGLTGDRVFKDRTFLSIDGKQIYIQCMGDEGNPILTLGEDSQVQQESTPSPALSIRVPISNPVPLTLHYPCNPEKADDFLKGLLQMVASSPLFSINDKNMSPFSDPFFPKLNSAYFKDLTSRVLIARRKDMNVYYIFSVLYNKTKNILEITVSTYTKSYQINILKKLIKGESPLEKDRFLSVAIGKSARNIEPNEDDTESFSNTSSHPDKNRNSLNLPEAEDSDFGYGTEMYLSDISQNPKAPRSSLTPFYLNKRLVLLFPLSGFVALINSDRDQNNTRINWVHGFQIGFWIKPIEFSCPLAPSGSSPVSLKYQGDINEILNDLKVKGCSPEILKDKESSTLNIFIPSLGLRLGFIKDILCTIEMYDAKSPPQNYRDSTNSSLGQKLEGK